MTDSFFLLSYLLPLMQVEESRHFEGELGREKGRQGGAARSGEFVEQLFAEVPHLVTKITPCLVQKSLLLGRLLLEV